MVIRSGDYVKIEQLAHIGHIREIPGPDWPVRTLKTVVGQLQATTYGGLKLRLGLWSQPCGEVLLLGSHNRG